VSFKSGLWVAQDHWKWHQSIGRYLSSILTTDISCIICEIRRDIGRKLRFFILLVANNPLGIIIATILRYFLHNRRILLGYNMVQK